MLHRLRMRANRSSLIGVDSTYLNSRAFRLRMVVAASRNPELVNDILREMDTVSASLTIRRDLDNGGSEAILSRILTEGVHSSFTEFFPDGETVAHVPVNSVRDAVVLTRLVGEGIVFADSQSSDWNDHLDACMELPGRIRPYLNEPKLKEVLRSFATRGSEGRTILGTHSVMLSLGMEYLLHDVSEILPVAPDEYVNMFLDKGLPVDPERLLDALQWRTSRDFSERVLRVYLEMVGKSDISVEALLSVLKANPGFAVRGIVAAYV